VAALSWLALSGLFALYTSYSSSYSRTYGSIAGAIILLLWLYYSALAILFGAELNAELDGRPTSTQPAAARGLTRPGRR
jgi:membrane protein